MHGIMMRQIAASRSRVQRDAAMATKPVDGCARLYRIGVALLLLAGGEACKSKHEAKHEAKADELALPKFSFFLTSLAAMQQLSGSQSGFGGDLSFGESGEGAGLRGADKICTTLAEQSMPGSAKKQWRAFLSTTRGGAEGGPIHAADRVGEGPWYDRVGRLVAQTKPDLLMRRPAADEAIKNDLPNELGVPNHNPDGTGEVDNHDFLTGSNDKGQLFAADPHVTCDDWTKSEPDPADMPRVGHSWPRSFGMGGMGFPGFPDGGGFGGPPGRGGGPPTMGAGDADLDGGFPPGGPGPGGFPPGGFAGFDPDNWMSSLNEAGCGASANLVEMGPPRKNDPTVGSGGGYGGIYCFALSP
jgi:hypothetical protein